MEAATLTLWTTRPPRRVCAFGALLGACAALAIMVSFWPLVHDNAVACGLLVLILMLTGVRWLMQRNGHGLSGRQKACALGRIASSHWRVTFTDSSVADGCLCHAWYGWGWVTLRIQPYAQRDAITLTVWRASVSAVAWHQLRVWTAWELVMVAPPEFTEVQQ